MNDKRTPYDDTGVVVGRSQAQIRDMLKKAEARVEQLEREVDEEWVTRGMPSWRNRAKRAEAAFAECKRRRECDRERIAEAEATIERLEWMLVEVDHGASIDDAASRWTPEKAAE